MNNRELAEWLSLFDFVDIFDGLPIKLTAENLFFNGKIVVEIWRDNTDRIFFPRFGELAN